ncbi:interferon-inducible GTPase 5-like [Hemiscyllium ocellatum]|uniref:interferon-inducible GTPase 5-like n=1 Tax=Hemiscyllium ocellatum TaxID=170820 RepID=UPI0029675924|nr:interferon-inducible GTPase 5-like [Hemiscyllium ocellatum]XP_060688562.1 interferon-inducible GTPase 5-like [Hemiscyllium ocellatum]
MGGASSRDQRAETSNRLEDETVESSNSTFFTNEELTKLQSDYDMGGVEKVKTVVQQKVTELDNTELNIAVTGESGAGKSSFINAMRGLEFDDEGAAEVGNIETTMEPTGYKHPNLPNVCFWDLPGIGTKTFPANKYLKKMKFKRYDFFIIISACRFTENDIQLAKEIKRLGKNFYFVRSKIDNDLYSKRRRGRQFNEEEELKKIRNDCVSKLQEAGMPSPRVFLISNFDLNLYDFSLLNKALEDDLPTIKKSVYILALPNISSETVEKKRKELRKQVWMLATLSGGIGVVPIPGVSLGCDIGIVIGGIVHFRQCLGLDDSSLQSLAKRAGKPVEDLKAVVTTPLVGGEITPDVINRLAWGAAAVTASAIEVFLDTIPVIGSIFGAGSSFFFTYKLLSAALDDLTESAQKVMSAAFGNENDPNQTSVQ